MQTDLFSAAFSILVAAIFLIAANAIAAECYDKNPDYKATKASNFNFTVVNIVSAVALVLFSIYSMVVAWRTPRSY